MTAIFAATSLATSVANELNDKFAYNYAVDERNQVTEKVVYKADGKYLEHHLKYAYAYDEAVEFRERLKAMLDELGLGSDEEIEITHISSVIAVHTGPYALGIGIIAKARLD